MVEGFLILSKIIKTISLFVGLIYRENVNPNLMREYGLFL